MSYIKSVDIKVGSSSTVRMPLNAEIVHISNHFALGFIKLFYRTEGIEKEDGSDLKSYSGVPLWVGRTFAVVRTGDWCNYPIYVGTVVYEDQHVALHVWEDDEVDGD